MDSICNYLVPRLSQLEDILIVEFPVSGPEFDILDEYFFPCEWKVKRLNEIYVQLFIQKQVT